MPGINDIDIERLISPISEDNHGGEVMRDDVTPHSTYYRLKDLRTKARNQERRMLTDTEELAFDTTDWKVLYEEVPEILETRSKDLELLAWYIEAATRINGFAGLTQGFDMATALIEGCWDALYPLPDEDGVSTRLAPIIGLNGFESEGSLIMPILGVPFTQPDGTNTVYATWQYEQAAEVDMITDPAKKEEKIASGALALSTIQQAIAESQPEFIEGAYSDLLSAIEAYKRLQTAIDNASPDDPQPTTYITATLQRCEDVFRYLAQHVIDRVTQTDEELEDDADEASSDAGKTSSEASSSVDDRQQALKQLRLTAQYFRKSEPHSPVSYLIEQAIAWSQKSLPDLLQELITDDSARQDYCRLTGIAAQQQSESNE